MRPPKPPYTAETHSPERLPQRKTVTIVAGFRTEQGVVLCADTEETVGGLSKRNVPKLRFEPSAFAEAERVLGGQNTDLAVAFCGATSNGPFVDEIVDRAWEEVQSATNLGEACDLIKQSIKHSFREFGQIYQPGYLPEAELIYGVKMDGYSRLFYSLGPAVNEKKECATGGIGAYMADFVTSRMYRHTLKLRQCIILAAYVLFQAKEHVSGCGGESHIAVLRNDDTSGIVEARHVEMITRLVQEADSEVSDILMRYANLGLAKEEFLRSSQALLQRLADTREHERKALNEWNEMWERLFQVRLRDDLGLPARNNKQDSEPHGS